MDLDPAVIRINSLSLSQVIDICTEMQKKGHAASLNLDLISADHLR